MGSIPVSSDILKSEGGKCSSFESSFERNQTTKSPFRVSNFLRGVFLSDRLLSISQKSAQFSLVIKGKKEQSPYLSTSYREKTRSILGV